MSKTREEMWLSKYIKFDTAYIAKKEMTWKKALELSILKWKGLCNYSKYDLHKRGYSLRDHNDQPVFDTSDCPLCEKAVNCLTGNCSKCPIVKVTGLTCDGLYELELSPWSKWLNNNDPEPMLALLKKVYKVFCRNR